MTIIEDRGEVWKEQQLVTVVINNAAGFYDSAIIPLERRGRVIDVAMADIFAAGNNNTQALGFRTIFFDGAATYTFGRSITEIFLRINKEAGTAGVTNVFILVTLTMKK